jgi:hypothetical protein
MSIYRWNHDDLDHAIHTSSNLICSTLRHFNRAHGLLDRLQAAIGKDVAIAVDSLLARKLRRDARALRTLARQIDHAAKKLTGAA